MRNKGRQVNPRGHAEGGSRPVSRHCLAMELLSILGGLVFSLWIPGLAAQVPVNSGLPHRMFVSPDRTFRFTYPGSLVLCRMNSQNQSCVTYIPICDDTAAACVAYRPGEYDGYNFEGAAFSVNELRQSNTESNCLKAMNSTARTELINGVEFRSSKQTSAAMGHGLSESAYRTFHHGACYELDIRIATSNMGAHAPGTIKEFKSEDERTVQAFLGRALSSFKFLK